jgi:hypothetical protein
MARAERPRRRRLARAVEPKTRRRRADRRTGSTRISTVIVFYTTTVDATFWRHSGTREGDVRSGPLGAY